MLALTACGTPGVTVDAAAPPFTNGTSTLAGSEWAAYVDGGRDSARFHNPVNVRYHDGKIYVADFDNGKIRVVGLDGTTTTLVDQHGFGRPFGIAFTANGTMYVSTDEDSSDRLGDLTGTLWRVDPATGVATVVTANLGRPRGLAPLPDGRIAIADYTHHAIELLDPATGAVSILAGAWGVFGMVDAVGAAARFAEPYQIVLASDGALVVTDYLNGRLRRVTLDGTVTTLAGGGSGFADGAAADARFAHPEGLAIDAAGDLFITDVGNARIRRYHAGMVETIAGDGTPGYLDSDDNLAAEFYGLEGLTVTPDGTSVYVADGTQGTAVPYNRVRWVKLPGP